MYAEKIVQIGAVEEEKTTPTTSKVEMHFFDEFY